MHIFKHLADGLPVTDIDAYGAIEYIDKKSPDKIHLCHFNDGELAAYRFKDHPGVFWSSSELHATQALKLSGLKAAQLDLKENVVYAVFENNLFETPVSLDFQTYQSVLKWDTPLTKQDKALDDSEFVDDFDDLGVPRRAFYSGSFSYKEPKAPKSPGPQVFASLKELEEQERLEALSGQKLLFDPKTSLNK